MNDSRPLVLLVDDDADILPLAEEAFKRAGIEARLLWLGDGGQLLSFLRRQAPYAAAGRPSLVLLDLNMPVMDGRSALKAVKADPALRAVPVLVLTSADDEEEVRSCYESGANAFIKKPLGFGEWQKAASAIGKFWLETAILPEDAS